jgi:nucleotide-binding universal stress UspA family protein
LSDVHNATVVEGDTEAAFELGTDGPRSIVVGVDGSPTSLRAGAYAAGLARRQRSRLTVVFARSVGPSAPSAYDPTGASLAAQAGKMDYVQQQLVEQIERSTWAVDAHLEVRTGPPLRVITAVAEKVRAEAVVVGCSRRSGFLVPGGSLPVQLMRVRRWPVIVVP